MLWLADECVSPYPVRALRAAKDDVVFVLEGMRESPDVDVLAMAGRERRFLLTEDMDFGELIFRERLHSVAGVVLIRMRSRDKQLKWRRLHSAILQYGERLLGHYLVVEETRFRMRALPARSSQDS